VAQQVNQQLICQGFTVQAAAQLRLAQFCPEGDGKGFNLRVAGVQYGAQLQPFGMQSIIFGGKLLQMLRVNNKTNDFISAIALPSMERGGCRRNQKNIPWTIGNVPFLPSKAMNLAEIAVKIHS
jgi:hypothetical protein